MYVPSALENFFRSITQTKSPNFNPHHNPPKYLYLEITSECNFRCKQCHLWMSKEGKDGLSTEEKLNIIRQFHRMNNQGIVSFTGGETMTKLDEFFALSSLCRSLGLISFANTNASYITNNLLDKILTEGPQHLIISLDSHRSEIHDYIRGVKGSHAQIIASIRSLVELRRKKYKGINTKIGIMSIIFDKNIYLLKDFINFAKSLEVDGVVFQVLNKTFNNQDPKDSFFTEHFLNDKEKCKSHIDEISKEFGDDPFVYTKKMDWDFIKLYIDNPNSSSEQVCNSHEKNIMVDMYGNIQLCFNMRQLNNGNFLGNTRNNDLKNIWPSQDARTVRNKMSTCRASCGMMVCHKKESVSIL